MDGNGPVFSRGGGIREQNWVLLAQEEEYMDVASMTSNVYYIRLVQFPIFTESLNAFG